MDAGPEAFVDGLSAHHRRAQGAAQGRACRRGTRVAIRATDVGEHLDELRFEVAELRGRFESMQASLDAILERTRSDRSGGTSGEA